MAILWGKMAGVRRSCERTDVTVRHLYSVSHRESDRENLEEAVIDHVRNFLLWSLIMVGIGLGYELSKVNANLKLIADRIREANMTYEEYCEYYPEECEELF